MGCLRRIGCLVVLLLALAAGWLLRDRWWPGRGAGLTTSAPAATSGVEWQPLTAEGAARARAAVATLGQRSGPVFANVAGADLAALLLEELTGVLPSARGAEAAVIGNQLAVRASVRLTDFGGARSLGPLAGMLGEREVVQFGGTFDIVRPGLAEYRVTSLRVRDFALPRAAIPRLLSQLRRTRPAGVAPDGLPLVVPRTLADVRVARGKVTLYKSVP